MRSSHVFTGFGSLFLGYSHGVSPFSSDTQYRVTALFYGYFKILQRIKCESYRFFAACTAGSVQIYTTFMTQSLARFVAERF